MPLESKMRMQTMGKGPSLENQTDVSCPEGQFFSLEREKTDERWRSALSTERA